MKTTTNIDMSLRLALLSPNASSALLFEPSRARRAGGGGSSGGGGPRSPPRAASKPGQSSALVLDFGADVAVRQMPLQGTLLANAVGAAPRACTAASACSRPDATPLASHPVHCPALTPR